MVSVRTEVFTVTTVMKAAAVLTVTGACGCVAGDVFVITTGDGGVHSGGDDGEGGDGDEPGLVDGGSSGHVWECHSWRWMMVAEFTSHGGDGGDGDGWRRGSCLHC